MPAPDIGTRILLSVQSQAPFSAIIRLEDGRFERVVTVSRLATRERVEEEIGRAILGLLEQNSGGISYWPEGRQGR